MGHRAFFRISRQQMMLSGFSDSRMGGTKHTVTIESS